ncbi:MULTISPECIES: hypothetical protein [Microvirgula]|uniref:hypothetical protein n=1 Tax=Microvirgula TaxID=57479 RepID=UPI0011BFADE2|nr:MULTISPECIES: hypothetical protein [Microvirgula]
MAAAQTQDFRQPSNAKCQFVLLRIEFDANFIKYAATIDVHQPPEVRKGRYCAQSQTPRSAWHHVRGRPSSSMRHERRSGAAMASLLWGVPLFL